ncbi:cell wall hydrolase [Shimazuella sp. AN120528]|uniref:cell wall hydrolase n=1 Tax=Shimazuella soli TaxID=1892854 RepID=UPI001F0E5234|nr:cell wall hydrolase [Shimazuella soli]MCH5583471.1 cell wall hydrolase [Shimazuella soli]
MLTKYVLVLSSLFSFIFVHEQTPRLASSTIHQKAEQSIKMKDAQQRLKKLGLYQKPVSSRYDAYTRNTFAQFQADYDLPINGTLDQKTSEKLHQLTTVKPAPVKVIAEPAKPKVIKVKAEAKKPKKSYVKKYPAVHATEEEVRLLAKAVHSEARGENFKGKVAVAAVILNRTEEKGFPHSIRGVIFQPRAFTAVSDGQFNLRPSKEAYRAAREALDGYDPTHGAIFYYNPQIATSSWMIEEAKKHDRVRIGQHVFFK